MRHVEVSWHEKALCVGLSHLFFGPDNERSSAKQRREQQAKSICFKCPVIEQCRNHARSNSEYGIWGGESEEDRYKQGISIPDPAVKRRVLKERKKNVSS